MQCIRNDHLKLSWVTLEQKYKGQCFASWFLKMRISGSVFCSGHEGIINRLSLFNSSGRYSHHNRIDVICFNNIINFLTKSPVLTISVPIQNAIAEPWMAIAKKSFQTPESDSSSPEIFRGKWRCPLVHLLWSCILSVCAPFYIVMQKKRKYVWWNILLWKIISSDDDFKCWWHDVGHGCHQLL